MISFTPLLLNARTSLPLTINIISNVLYNGAGKEADTLILKNAFEKSGHCVNLCSFDQEDQIPSAHINVFLAHCKFDLFSKAALNWLIPNPETCRINIGDLQKFDLVICKTEECLRIFTPLCKEVYFLGFTSFDKYQPTITKDFSKYIHVAGKSPWKGTEEILNVWTNHFGMPNLILITSKNQGQGIIDKKSIEIIHKHLPDDLLLSLQNECGVHLCPSKTEGFGHYLMEAMSAQAVVITTDAPPMNEFIKDKRCLVKYCHTHKQHYGTMYKVDEQSLAETVSLLKQLPVEELHHIAKINREEYLRRKNAFKHNFENLMQQAELYFQKLFKKTSQTCTRDSQFIPEHNI